MNKPDLILVDGSAYLFRAYHALPALSNSKGEPTGAIVGVVSMLDRLLKEYQPKHMAVVFDTPEPNFRHKLYPAYKANRGEMPEELQMQIEPLLQIIQAMGLPLIQRAGIEADDIIGSLAKQAEAQGWQVLISTSDKDMAQLVSPQIELVDTMKDRLLNEQGVVAEFGVSAAQIADYLALLGDSSDNIPGVPRCGKKTAVSWLQKYGDIENLIAHSQEIGGTKGDNLRAAIDQLRLAKKLTQIQTDLDLGMDLDDLRIGARDEASLRDHFVRLEAKRLLDTLQQDQQSGIDYRTITEAEDLQAQLAQLQQAPYWSFDLETTSLDPISAEIVGIALSWQPQQAIYIPVAHQRGQQLDLDWVLQQLKPLWQNEQPKLAQNMKYDLEVLARYGIAVKGPLYDTMLESYVLNSAARHHDLNSLAQQYLQHTAVKFEDIAGKGRSQKRFDQIEIATASYYACEDADLCLRLHQKIYPQLEDRPRHLFHQIEMPLVPVLARMERRGVLLNEQALRDQSKELEVLITQLEAQAYALAGHEFKLNSPQQLAQVLFEELGLPVIKRTNKGQASTAEPILQELAEQGHELPALILIYRNLSKLKSTYLDKLPAKIHPQTGRVHTQYHQTGTVTGRLSSSDPNLQNIPVRTEEGRRIRQAFIAPPQHQILAADYSQIELRLMAHFSQDSNLLKAFHQDQDVHRATAAEIFDLPLEQVDQEHRRRAKAVNFGLLYGMSAFGLSQQLDIHPSEAQKYIDLYFERYPKVLEFMESTKALARSQGYVETLFGRRIYLPHIKSRNPSFRQANERAAINGPLQGSAADLIKKAMISIDAWIEQEQVPLHMIMQVHDELVFEVADDFIEPARQQIQQIMQGVAQLDVPLIVDIGIGANWAEAH